MIIFNELGAQGRLGNQLFQVAATLSHAHHMGVEAAFNKWEYGGYFLNRINDRLEKNEMMVDGRLHDQVNHLKFGYIPIPRGRNQVLLGFFQSHKYIDPIAAHKYFLPGNELMKQVRDAGSSHIHRLNTCSIHVRRGDYLIKQDFHPVQPMSYYTDAMARMEKLHGPCNYLIFSDDIEWCKTQFDINKHHFVSKNSEIVDLYLMASCKHHIVANSSFSWWGSYLSAILDPDYSGTTIAPLNWCGPKWKEGAKGGDVWTDIYLPNWIVI